MLIIGCDYHPGFQQIAFVDDANGDCGERRLEHREEAEKFYRQLWEQGGKVCVGMEQRRQSKARRAREKNRPNHPCLAEISSLYENKAQPALSGKRDVPSPRRPEMHDGGLPAIPSRYDPGIADFRTRNSQNLC